MTTSGRGTGSLPKAITLAVALAASGALLMYVFAGLMDKFRIMRTNGVMDSWESSFSMPLMLMIPLLAFGIIANSVLRSAVATAARQLTGRAGAALRMIPFGTLGAFVVSLFLVRLMTAPTTVGWKEDPTFGHREAWDWSAWVFYYLPFVLPVLLAAIALMWVWFGFTEVRADRRRGNAVTNGSSAPGRITALTSGPAAADGTARLAVSLQFTDHTGAPRHATVIRPAPLGQTYSIGQPVVVFYDRNNPTNEAAVTFGLAATDTTGRA